MTRNPYTVTGDVTGDLTGNVSGAVVDTTGARYQGNLPAAASHAWEFWSNGSAGDSLWLSNGTSWVLIAPEV